MTDRKLTAEDFNIVAGPISARHPNYAAWLNTLVALLEEEGLKRQARHCRDGYTIREVRSLWRTHPDIAERATAIAMMLFGVGHGLTSEENEV